MKKIYLVLLILVIGILLANPVLRRDMADSVMEGITGKTQSQREYKRNVEKIEQGNNNALTELKLDKETKELQSKGVAETEVEAAKSTGSKKVLLDSVEYELLELRESYDNKTEELREAISEGDEEKQEELLVDIANIEELAHEDMLILEAGNRV